MTGLTNPPAFPSRVDEPIRGGGAYRNDRPGMSLRDWFAGQAIPAVVKATSAGQHHPMSFAEASAGADLETFMARDAYRIADAMLAEREKS